MSNDISNNTSDDISDTSDTSDDTTDNMSDDKSVDTSDNKLENMSDNNYHHNDGDCESDCESDCDRDDDNDDNDDDEEIRIPDKIYKDKLIDESNDGSNIDTSDNEMKLALDVSRKQYLTDNNIYDDISIEDLLMRTIEISIDEYSDKLEEIAKEESLKLEDERIKNVEISKRKKSLEEFSKRIKSLSFSINEIELKNFIENVLNDYFNLSIEFVNLDKDMYEKIYKIVDSYYLIPIQKNYKKTAISQDEDSIIRDIFRNSD